MSGRLQRGAFKADELVMVGVEPGDRFCCATCRTPVTATEASRSCPRCPRCGDLTLPINSDPKDGPS